MSSSPQVRDACQNCHRRKIRCILSPGSSACQTCSSSRTPCLFAPRAKAGRPRRAPTSDKKDKSSSSSSSKTAASSKSDGSFEISNALFNPTGQDNIVLSVEDNGRFDTAESMMGHLWSPKQMSGFQGLVEMDFMPTTDNNGPFDYLSRAISHPSLNRKDLPTHAAHGLLTPSTTPLQMKLPFETPLNDRPNFDTILQLCGDLDRYCRVLQDGLHIGNTEVDAMVKLIGCTYSSARSCISICSAGKASSALILAATYKVFELCETLVGHIESEAASAKEDVKLECLVRLKRLDVSLLEAKIFFMWAGNTHGDAEKKLSQIHTWIQSIIKDERFHSLW